MSEPNHSLKDFLEKLKDYEPAFMDIINDYTKTYTFNNKNEIRIAVKLWSYNKDKCIERYENISH
jgi:hypothetical protein